MMVRYAGPKVFVALQQTEDIHDEGGTGKNPWNGHNGLGRFDLPLFWRYAQMNGREMIW